MCSSLSLMSIVAILVMDVRIGAIEQELKGLECHQCLANSTSCEQPAAWTSVECPAAAPYCATVALAPNFRSYLTCSADTKTPCSLTYTPENKIQLSCVCKQHLCNTPLSQQLRNQLVNFSSKTNTSSNLTESFYKIAFSANSTERNLYKEITTAMEVTEIALKNTSQVTTLPPVNSAKTNAPSITIHAELPRAEALKQEATAPSDDDEDENEGSGAYEEARSHHAASPPAAPSSFLPANESKASSLLTNLILITSLVACSLV